MVEQGRAEDLSLFTLVRRFVLFSFDLSVISRYVGHVTVALLLLFAVLAISPSRLPGITWEGLSVPSARSAGVVISASSTDNESHYLEYSTVPFTTRMLREVLPMAETQITVRSTVIEYEVQPGDTTLGIAQKFGLQGTTLLYANEELMDGPDSLAIGQTLHVPPVDGAYHIIAAGESLESIASKFKVDPSAIISFAGNNITADSALQAGQGLIIPGGVRQPKPKPVQAAAPAQSRASSTSSATSSSSAAAPEDAPQGSGQLVWPLTGMISQKYWEGHQAVDVATRIETPVMAADAGFIETIQNGSTGYGRMIIVNHGNGVKTLYAHLNSFNVEVGQTVSRGQIIAGSGNTGRSTGPHLHFEVIVNGVRRNPFSYLP